MLVHTHPAALPQPTRTGGSSAPLGRPAGRTRSHTVELPCAHTVPTSRPLGAGPLWGSVCRVVRPAVPGLCAPLGDDPTFATRRQNCQPSQVRRGFSNSRTVLTAWSEIGLKADDLHRQARRTGLERRSVRRTRFAAYWPVTASVLVRVGGKSSKIFL